MGQVFIWINKQKACQMQGGERLLLNQKDSYFFLFPLKTLVAAFQDA